MDKVQYQILRDCIGAAIHDCRNDFNVSDSDLVNNIMRICLASTAKGQVRTQRIKREFLTFRRSPDVKAPSWAYRNPGIDSRLPKL